MIRKAKLCDVKKIYNLIDSFAKKDFMLPRSVDALYESIRDFFVWEDKNGVCGCVALHVSGSDLAEIKSLAVEETCQKMGIGTNLINSCIEEAKVLGLKRIFALTYKPAFFKKFGFKEIDKSDLPHKIWNECIACPKFPGCAEIAMMREVK